jgi:hypothetical protein
VAGERPCPGLQKQMSIMQGTGRNTVSLCAFYQGVAVPRGAERQARQTLRAVQAAQGP